MLCVYESPHINFRMPESVFMKLGMHIMAPEPISTAVLHKFLPSVCVSVCVSLLSLLRKGSVKCISPFIARKRLGKNVLAATNTHNKGMTVVASFSMQSVSYQRESVGLCIPLSLLGDNEELLEVSFCMRSVSYQRKLGD
jgi:hypothetical protein